MDIFEPADLYWRRQKKNREDIDAQLYGPMEDTGWRNPILRYLKAHPDENIREIGLPNIISKQCRAETRAEKELVKRTILKDLRHLIRQKIVAVWKRIYVRLTPPVSPKANKQPASAGKR